MSATMKGKTDFDHALNPLVWRLVIVLFGITLSLWSTHSCNPARYRIGTRAIVYNHTADLFIDRAAHVHVLDSRLEDGRGIVARADGDMDGKKYFTLLVADVWEPMYEFEVLDPGGDDFHIWGEQQPEAEKICPEGECAPIDHGGLIADAFGFVLRSETHARRLQGRQLEEIRGPDAHHKGWRLDRYVFHEKYSKYLIGPVHDAAAIAPGVVIAAQTGDPELDSSGRVRPGSLMVYDSASQEPPKPVAGVQVTRPVGIAYVPVSLPGAPADPVSAGKVSGDGSQPETQEPATAPPTGVLFVADISETMHSWRRFNREGDRYTESGIVWSMPRAPGASWPRLQHMVVGRSRAMSPRAAAAPGGDPSQHVWDRAVFAGGPDGLYVFGAQGGLLAKYALDAPVAGLAWGAGGHLFMTIGRRLAYLQTRALAIDPPFRLGDVEQTPVRSGGEVAEAGQFWRLWMPSTKVLLRAGALLLVVLVVCLKALNGYNALPGRGGAPLPFKSVGARPVLQLQLARHDKDVQTILDVGTPEQRARNVRDLRAGNTLDSIVFIPAYMLFLATVFVLLVPPAQTSRRFVWIVLIAIAAIGLLDWIENYGIARAANHLAHAQPFTGDAAWIATPGRWKWHLLVLVLGAIGVAAFLQPKLFQRLGGGAVFALAALIALQLVLYYVERARSR